MKRITMIGAVLALFAFVMTAAAQQYQGQNQDQSLADFAKKVHKENGPSAKPKVYDNDNLPTSDKLSVVGQPTETASNGTPDANGDPKDATKDAAKAPGDKAATGEKKDGAKGPADDEKAKQAAWKTWQDKVNSQKSEITLASRELDVMQREYQLRAAAMYADAGNRLRNEASWDKEDADYKQKIADKQKAVDDAKQKLSDIQEEARKAGVPSSMTE
jgi:hypothetical protein